MVKIITLEEWLNMFKNKNISIQQFIEKFYVKSGNKIKKFKDIIKEKNLKKTNIKTLYNFFVIKKEENLVNFYNKSLRILEDLDLNKVKTLSLSNSKNSTYKNLIRNIYYKDILLYTKTDIKGLRPFLEVIFDLYNNNTIDYKLLTPGAIKMMERNIFASILSGFYFRSSILNPVVIYTLSKKYIKNASRVFTPTLGWSSYMYGFLSDEKIKEYVGTDVIKSVCYNTEKLAKRMFPKKYVDIYCSQSELLIENREFMKEYKNYFDVVFFSPPYYKLELYRGSKQSTTLYNTYEMWLDKYWKTTIKLCREVLHRKGKLIYIISGYDKQLNMNTDMNNITKKYFKYIKKMNLANTNVNFTNHKDTNEIIYFFDIK